MTFDQIIEIILQKEGGLVNHPKDPGGLTNFGIAQKYYPQVDIKNLTKDQAKAIYKADYYDKIQGDKLPPSLRLAALDCAINQGVGTCAKLLQACVGATVDGHIGPVTIKLLNEAPERILLINFIAFRKVRYKNTENADVFLKGWTNRLTDIAIASGLTAADLRTAVA